MGADLDFDVLVSQSAGVRALTQRLGRYNRLGDRNAHARGAIVHVPGDDPVYAGEPDALIERLRAGTRPDAEIDLGPEGISLLGAPADEPRRAGHVLPAHVWEWVKTSVEHPGEAPPELFFDGLDEDRARVVVLWRAWLPPVADRCVPLPDDSETVEVSLHDVRDLIGKLDEDEWRILGHDGEVEGSDPRRLRPGATVILAAEAGGYTADGWSSTATGTVPDLSILHGRALPLAPSALRHLTNVLSLEEGWAAPILRALGEVASDPDHDLAPVEAAVAAIVDAASPDLRGVLDKFEGGEVRSGPGGVPILLPAKRARGTSVGVRLDAFDDLSFDATATSLDEHNGAVGETAARLAAAIGLPAVAQRTVRLAGELHDLGKCEPRFQRWLDPDGSSETVLAKSAGSRSWTRTRIAAGWPSRGRHELLSGRAAAAWLSSCAEPDRPDVDEDLLLHLVVSHHGGGRPLVSTVFDPLGAPFTASFRGKELEVTGDLGRDDWDQPARFRRVCERYGYWGVALLEAVLRQADHAASAAVVPEGEVDVA